VLTPMPEIRDGLYLTTHRVIYAGTQKIWGMIPNGKAMKAAFIADIDVGGLYTRRLPFRLMALGLFALLLSIGLFTTSQSDTSTTDYTPAAVLLLLVGLLFVALWLFVRRSVLAFNVAGDETFEHGIYQADRTNTLEFLNAFFDIKANAAVLPSPRAGRGLEF
jgi:hypothetical protein